MDPPMGGLEPIEERFTARGHEPFGLLKLNVEKTS